MSSGAPGLALIWTTTPWTLPSNSAIAVGPSIGQPLVEDRRPRGVLAGERALIAPTWCSPARGG